MPISNVTSKGQITIPKVIRDSLGLHAGDKVEFIIGQNGEILFKPVTRKVCDVFGFLHQPGVKAVSIDEMDEIVKNKIKDTFH